MSRVAFARCPWGEYFRGPACPLDGYQDDVSLQLDSAVAQIDGDYGEISRATLSAAGLSNESLRDVVIIDFDEAVSPWLYFKLPEQQSSLKTN